MLQVQPRAAWSVTDGVGSACLQFAEALQANVWSAFNVLKGSVKAMMKSKKGGSVVLMSSSGLCLLQWQHLPRACPPQIGLAAPVAASALLHGFATFVLDALLRHLAWPVPFSGSQRGSPA